MSKRLQSHDSVRYGLGCVCLTVWALLSSGFLVEAQPRPFRIGVLTSGLAFNKALVGLREELAQLGYTHGKNLTLLVEDAQGATEQLGGLATKLLAASPDLIFTTGTAATTAAKRAITTLPIVFVFVADPVRASLVASHVSSGNNLTGISNHAGALSGKRLEYLQEIYPEAKRVLVLVMPGEHVSLLSFDVIATVAPKLGMTLVRREVSSREEIAQVLTTLPAGSVDAIFYVPSGLIGPHIALLLEKAREARIPLVGHEDSIVEQGALMSYGADFRLLGKQAARLAVKIMQGAKPSDIPIQTPERLSLAINLTTAHTLGLKIPRHVLETADLLIE